jgi:hypothetical protein
MDLFLAAVLVFAMAWTLVGELHRLRKEGKPENDVFPLAISAAASMFVTLICVLGAGRIGEAFGHFNLGVALGGLICVWAGPRMRGLVEARVRPPMQSDR